MRLGWLALLGLTLGLFVGGLPLRLDDIRWQYGRQIGFGIRQSEAGEVLASPWPGSPAARAGVMERDVVLAVDGQPVVGADGIERLREIARGRIGTPLALDVRTGQRPVRRYVLTLGGDEARWLYPLGLTYSLVASYALIMSIGTTLVLVAIAGLIMWYRSSEWQAVLVALTMLAFVAGTPPVLALYGMLPAWHASLDFLFGLALASVLLALLLFPDGRFVPRGGRVAGLIVALWLIGATAFPQLYPWRMAPVPGLLTLLAGLAAGIAAQVYRYLRDAGPGQRQQTRLVVIGACAAAIGITCQVAVELLANRESTTDLLRDELVVRPLSQILIGLLPVFLGIALFRYHLWNVEVFVNRTLVYGLLTATVVIVYGFVVGVLSRLFSIEGNVLVSLLASGTIALLFEPMRRRVQGGVNRLMYGERDEPYVVLSRISRQLGSAMLPDAVLPSLVAAVREALRLPYAAIALRGDDELRIVASAGEERQDALYLPLQHQGEVVGEFRVGRRGPGEDWTVVERRLLEDLASQAGTAANAVRLTANLQQLSGELQQARERLVLAREEERRRLRRDLHDELAPTLAALGLTVTATRKLIRSDQAALHLLDELGAGLRAAVGDIRRIAYELRPPVLDELGLVDAIRDRAARYNGYSGGAGERSDSSLQVAVDAPGDLPALPAAVEVAAYRIIQEALMNVIRHAGARQCTISLRVDGAALQLDVVDDGVGVQAASAPGVGLRSMRERAVELGGLCAVEPLASGGTRVHAWIPIGKEVLDGSNACPDRG